ncbi:MAG: hypothetical protein HC904_16945 [Blastochloris sp.]|nr:hypothetical protein [Blastochloris sp.]
MKTKFLVLIFTCLFSSHLLAGLGMSVEGLKKQYGQPINERTRKDGLSALLFEKDKVKIDVVIHDDKCIVIMASSKDPMTSNYIESLLKSSSEGSNWKKQKTNDIIPVIQWSRLDGQAYAISIEETEISIHSKKYDELTQKK